VRLFHRLLAPQSWGSLEAQKTQKIKDLNDDAVNVTE